MKVASILKAKGESVETTRPDTTISTIVWELRSKGIVRVRHIPVVEGGKLRGIVSIGDAVKHRVDELELEANVLREAHITRH